MRRTLLTVAVLLGAAACGLSTGEPLPLTIRVEPSRATAAPGDAIDFVVTAQGGNLLELDIDYGDTESAQFAAGGSQTAKVTFRHAYSAGGSFHVVASVTDVNEVQRNATVDITVQ